MAGLEREAFEKWVSGPPFERMPQRYGEESAWPGNYKNPDVQLAWAAWQDSPKAKVEEVFQAVEFIRENQ